MPLHNDQWLVSDRAPLFAVALLFWTAWQLTMLTLVALASFDRPRQPDEDDLGGLAGGGPFGGKSWRAPRGEPFANFADLRMGEPDG